MADYSGYLYHPTSGLPLVGVKTQAFNATTGVLLATVYTDSTGKWDFGALSVIPTIYAYTEFGIRLVLRGEIVGTIGANVDVVTGGAFRANATAILTGDGFYTAYNAGVPVLRIGTVSGGALVKGLYWDGANLAWIGVNTSLTAAGLFTATNAVITGTITAGAGAIGGFTIGADYIRDAADSFGLASTVSVGDDVRFWAGATFANRATAPFRITEAGVLAATSGVIGGWTLGASYFYTALEGLAPGDYPFYAGVTYANRATAPFRVTSAGALVATSATITGAITASSGSFSGVLSIGASGGIFQGTGTFAVPTTALKIYSSGGIGLLEMWGAGVKQVYFGTDGKLYAGGGNVKLDSAGLSLNSGTGGEGKISWFSGANVVAYLEPYHTSVQTEVYLYSKAGIATESAGVLISATANITPNTQVTSISLWADDANPADSYIIVTVANTNVFRVTSTGFRVDQVTEMTTNAGVTVEAVLLKDGYVSVPTTGSLRAIITGSDYIEMSATTADGNGLNIRGTRAGYMTSVRIWPGPAPLSPSDRSSISLFLTDYADQTNWERLLIESVPTFAGIQMQAGGTGIVRNFTIGRFVSGADDWTVAVEGATGDLWIYHNTRLIGGDFFLQAPAATASITTRDARFGLKGTYWDGGASQTVEAIIYHDILTVTPTSQIGFYMGAVNLVNMSTTGLTLVTGALTLPAQTANYGFFGPASGGAAAPSFRAMVDADIATHDDTKHTDQTRSILLPPRVFGVVRGTLVLGTVSVGTDPVEVWLFDNAGALETIYTTLQVPQNYAGGNFTFKLRWAASSAAAGNTRWYLTYTLVDVGETIDQAREATLGVTSAAPEVANTEVEATVGASSAGLVAGKRMALHLHRASNEAGDTYEATAYVSALIIEYTATG